MWCSVCCTVGVGPGLGASVGALSALVEEGIEVGDFRMGQPSLEEVFFALTGRPGAAGEERRA